jgi:hypothetical protein
LDLEEGRRRLHNEELHNLHSSPYIIRVIKSRRLWRWVDDVACMKEMRNAYKILVGKPEGKDHEEDLGMDGRIILEWILGRVGNLCGTRFICLRIGTNGGL